MGNLVTHGPLTADSHWSETQSAALSRQSASEGVQILGLPWYLWSAAMAVTSVMIGGYWDISWHSSIGRDSFWTPAHMAIYLCGVLAGISFGFLILHTTFSKTTSLAESCVHIWGFRAPLGAFIASWGGITMLTSAPFDNWWHDAYGLDVKIVSPPHIVLFMGIYGVTLGTLALIASHMHRRESSGKSAARWLYLYLGGTLVVLTQAVILEYTNRIFLHTGLPYLLETALAGGVLALISRSGGSKFGSTFAAGFYMFFIVALILILPMFPAEPKLGPVYQQVTHFIPPQFPVLLVIPAIFLDLFWSKTQAWNKWITAAVSAAILCASLAVVEWPFASFLMTPAARNVFFGTQYLNYAIRPEFMIARNAFYTETALQLLRDFAVTVVLGTLTLRFGFSRGEWLKSLVR